MTWKHFFTSSLGKKYVMAFTGFFLITFLIVHAGINSCIFLNDNGKTFNIVGRFMSHNWIVRFLELGLFAGLIVHIIQGLMLWRQNVAARPVKYYSNKPEKNSTWYSRSMGLLGTLLLIFLVIHLAHFYVGTKVALYAHHDAPHNLYAEMHEVFQQWWVVAIYLLGIVALFWHLMHGFQSAFQSLGVNNKKFIPIINAAGIGYTVIICLAFALMPIAFHFGWITYTPEVVPAIPVH
ncbi:succinate dehydrogenase cytochrome b subunit [Ferruginibacter sp. HRS2-29]|uniref:succinate dehydrogenase cytochrome b subunit n=1 Tax=Ferruginibacter sp. HRS2-29 TaxID=2487334 RepID=UPI0020CC4902|nr:succinate dehydrogenase cytochrome b subunit [Ferruginibacter sp. HRS2-29]MCP9750597.1 succinate dehydrogenase [Ferruginibacter sp. HRS2-29]